MKRGILFGIGIGAIIIGASFMVWRLCGWLTPSRQPDYPSGVIPAQTGTSLWDPDYILTFDGYSYTVSTNSVTDVGAYLGSVSYHGFHSGGFRLYAVPKVPNQKAIAVQTKSGYLLAVENR